jgi:hypothetical protein
VEWDAYEGEAGTDLSDGAVDPCKELLPQTETEHQYSVAEIQKMTIEEYERLREHLVNGLMSRTQARMHSKMG